MRPNGTMNLRQIEAFVAILEQGSVTRAAETLHITQSAASRLVLRLEQELGFALFVRGRSRMQPTEEAKAFYVEAQRSFSGLREIEQAARRIRDIGTGTLRLCVMPTLQQGVLPMLVTDFCREHQGVSVMFDVQSYREVLQAVLRGTAEIGFATLPVEDENLAVTPLARSPAVCLLPATHPLARRTRLRVEDLRDSEFINVPRARFRDRIDRLFEEHGVRRRLRIEARTILAAAALVANGAGVCIVDPFSLEALNDPRVVAIPLTPAVNIEVGALRSTAQPLSLVGQRFLDYCAARIRPGARKRLDRPAR